MLRVALVPVRQACRPILRSVCRKLKSASVTPTQENDAFAPPVQAVPHVGKQIGDSRRKLIFDNRKTLRDFMNMEPKQDADHSVSSVPYLTAPDGQNSQFYVEVYGCQMNTNDTEILSAILTSAGFKRTCEIGEADVIFLMTCAIRDSAEQKIWSRLSQLKAMKTKRGKSPQIGLLGCMAERLKDKLLVADKLVDVVCGPDAYRSLPHLLALADDERQVANVMLSADETYADIMPLRLNPNQISANLSIMRGCNNMCAFCIVPFTRGIERSRPVESIVEEVRKLSEQGIKEVVLLGQNVNSYRDISVAEYNESLGSQLAPGFSTIYKRKDGGLRFAELLQRIAQVDLEMRIRFTSPHPKDFPMDLLKVIRDNPNVCNQVHLPAQSGSSTCLSRMRRGYSRETYMELVQAIRSTIPNVAISTDVIAGFCGETELEHADTVSLMKQVGYDQAFMFAYSMRERTHAHRKYVDDVPESVKGRRLSEIIDAHFSTVKVRHQQLIGTTQLVLVEGYSRRNPSAQKESNNSTQQWAGRAENNLKVHFSLPATVASGSVVGKYAAVCIESVSGASMSGRFVKFTSVQDFYKL